jgi:hypothetical protein
LHAKGSDEEISPTHRKNPCCYAKDSEHKAQGQPEEGYDQKQQSQILNKTFEI